jgi:hypothetical protein
MVSLLTLVELSIVEGRDNRGPRLVFFEEEWMEELLLDASVALVRLVEERRVAGMVGNLPRSGSSEQVGSAEGGGLFFGNKK